ncbi:hypothetical protein DYB28_013985 [Aphanomyces astaci]|uniref:BZIP domain-containing protein n=1 Tax=Aphanomyces astaci TaxID=112090 RepID=A0A9X8DX93_APHAT|nr:hypothetical protein DYB28_013985 [Aphanomyces astaci]
MALLAKDEKQIRRRLQCKMNMRCHRDRRKRSALQLEAAIDQLHRDVQQAQTRLAFYHSLPSPYDGPMAIVVEYEKLFSMYECGDVQVQFLRTCFSPTFTSNTLSLDEFIRLWQRAAPVYATPNNLLSILPIENDRIEMQVQLHTPLTRDVLGRVMVGYDLDDESPDTIDALVATNTTISHVLTRTFFFTEDEATGRPQVTHSIAVDDRYVQLGQLLEIARQSHTQSAETS